MQGIETRSAHFFISGPGAGGRRGLQAVLQLCSQASRKQQQAESLKRSKTQFADAPSTISSRVESRL